MLDNTDKLIITELQGNIALTSRPFAELARKIGITEAEAVERVRFLKDAGIIKRLAAILRHQQAGYIANALVAWRVDEFKADDIGYTMAGFDAVSHCYRREVPEDFGYNLFTMIHARNDSELSQLVEDISSHTGLKDYTIIRSVKEYKKVSMQYF